MNNPELMASIAAAIGDPARSKILLALMGGRALTPTELSLEAEVAPSTTSAHLAKLHKADLVTVVRQGRHRYVQISNEQVAELVERLGGLSGPVPIKTASGPKDPAMRTARVCYDHLAGELAVRLFESLVRQHWLELKTDGIAITDRGRPILEGFGIDVAALERSRRLTCRQCLDWSERRHHLAGSLGAALLDGILSKRWAERDLVGRTVRFSAKGEKQLKRDFRIP